MSPPIRDGSGNSIGSIRLGDGSEIAEVRTGAGDVLFSAGPPDSGVARYTFDNADTSGGTALDVFNNNDASINGATTGVSGANDTYTTNEAYSFDGNDDSVDTPVASNYAGAAGFSVAGWVNFDESTTGTLIGGISNDQGSGWAAKVDVGNDRLRLTKQAVSNVDLTGVSLSANTFFHVVFVVETDDDVSFYLDGNDKGTVSASQILTTTDDLVIGEDGIGNQFLAGDIDDPRLYSKALTATEVSNLYNNGLI